MQGEEDFQGKTTTGWKEVAMLLERKRADIAKAEEVGIRLEKFPKFHCRAEVMKISFFFWLRKECIYMGVSKNRGTPKCMVYNGNTIRMDDLGGPLFSETSIYILKGHI